MNYHKTYWIEKLQLQLSAAAMLAVIYFLIWPRVGNEDAATFLPVSNYGGLVVFAILLWALAGICSLTTISARPQSALIAAVVAAGGASLCSSQMQSFFWYEGQSIAGFFGSLIVEILILTIILIPAVFIVKFIRIALIGMVPSWCWKNPVYGLPDDKLAKFDLMERKDTALAGGKFIFMPVAVMKLLYGENVPQKERQKASKTVLEFLYCVLAGIGLAIALVSLLVQSPLRGQILFGLFAGLAGAIFIAHRFFPTPYSGSALIVTVVTAVCFYVYAAATFADSRPQAWMTIPFAARAFPVDWMTAGFAGAMLGFWMSSRMTELRVLERVQPPPEE